VLARCSAGQRIVDAILQRERQSVHLWIACLAHIDAEDTRESIVETALRGLEHRLTQGSSTEVAEVLCWLASYLRGEQARRALALATSVRSIAPRVRALAAIARAMSDDEGQIVSAMAWKAAQRSTNADVRGEALTTIVASMASSKFGQDTTGGSSADNPRTWSCCDDGRPWANVRYNGYGSERHRSRKPATFSIESTYGGSCAWRE
jgi:hypothetical protein